MELGKALFFDIESHRVLNWDQQTPAIQKAFKMHYWDPNTYEDPADQYSEIAGLHAEFGRVICISFCYKSTNGEIIKKSLYGKDEVAILEGSRKIFDAFRDNGYYLAGHNIWNCDVPFMVKRYIINDLVVPKMLNTYGKKPWEVDYLDTIDLWKFGDFKRVSLEMICASLGIACKSEDISGGNLWEKDIDDMPWDELVMYCEEDTVSNFLFAEKVYKLLG